MNAPAEDFASAVRWVAPALDAPANDPAREDRAEPELRLPSVEEIERITAAAHAEGFEAGRAEGFASGQSEVRRLVAQFEGIVDNLARPLAKLEDEVVAALSQLAVQVAGTLIGRAYEDDPVLLADLIREALDAVGPGQREVEVRLHPDDIGALAPVLPLMPDARLTADTTLARGDVRVNAESVRIDGTRETRLRAALDAVMQRSRA